MKIRIITIVETLIVVGCILLIALWVGPLIQKLGPEIDEANAMADQSWAKLQAAAPEMVAEWNEAKGEANQKEGVRIFSLVFLAVLGTYAVSYSTELLKTFLAFRRSRREKTNCDLTIKPT